MKRYFITGSGTDVGKTLVTAAIAYQLTQAGRRVAALKPVASGFDENAPERSDAAQLLAALGQRRLSVKELDSICPWRFSAPVAPDMAAAREGRELRLEEITAFCNVPRDADLTLIEGIGGVMSPLTHSHTVLDWMRLLHVPVILVAGSYVGSISHTLTALHILREAGLELSRLVLSTSVESAVSVEETAEAIRRFYPQPVHILCIPRLDSRTQIWKDVPNISEGLA